MRIRTSLVTKIVAGISVVATATYATSAFFIFVLKEVLAPNMELWLYSSLIFGLGVFWTGLLGWMTARWLVKPLNRLHRAADLAAGGNLKEEVVIPKSGDELMQLAVSFNQMIANLRGIVASIDEGSAATGTEVGHLRQSLEQVSELLNDVSERVGEISRNTDVQAEWSRSMFGSIEEIARISADAAACTEAARLDAARMTEAMDRSGEGVDAMSSAMNRLSEEGKDTAARMKELESHAEQIGQIVHSVEDISDRIRLLALNASIEAAHAGEHGQGFQVVASEIKKLADHTSSEVKRVDELVESIQADLRVAVGRVESQARHTLDEATRTSETTGHLGYISQSVHFTADAIRKISTLMDIQAAKMPGMLAGAQQVADMAENNAGNLGKIAEAVQEQNAMVQEVAAASNELQNRTEALHKGIGRFQI